MALTKQPFSCSWVLAALMLIPSIQQVRAQAADPQSSIRIQQLLERGAELYRETGDLDTLIRFYAYGQLGIPYVAGLLEIPPTEQLVVTLAGSDCVLFVEMTTALTLTTLSGSTRAEEMEAFVRMLRYRDGIIDGYFSRLHYFGDWLQDNERKGMMQILFQDTESYPKLEPYHFMTSKRTSYRQLAENDSLYQLMVLHEAQLNSHLLRYIPTGQIQAIEQELQTGDVVAFVTTVGGLDVSHTAIIKREGDRIGFWHASTTGTVMEEPKTLYQYTVDRKTLKGIIVARPTFTRVP